MAKNTSVPTKLIAESPTAGTLADNSAESPTTADNIDNETMETPPPTFSAQAIKQILATVKKVEEDNDKIDKANIDDEMELKKMMSEMDAADAACWNDMKAVQDKARKDRQARFQTFSQMKVQNRGQRERQATELRQHRIQVAQTLSGKKVSTTPTTEQKRRKHQLQQNQQDPLMHVDRIVLKHRLESPTLSRIRMWNMMTVTMRRYCLIAHYYDSHARGSR